MGSVARELSSPSRGRARLLIQDNNAQGCGYGARPVGMPVRFSIDVRMTLLERDHLLAELDRLLQRAHGGTGVLSFVSGEAGIGKTSLLREFVARATDTACHVWGGCDPLQTPTALGPLWDIVRQMNRKAARIAPDLERAQLFAALLDALSSAPLIVVLDDLHWADEATLDLVRYLGRRIDRTRALLIASYRDEELGTTHPLRLLLGDLATQRTARLALAPLSVEAVRTLAGTCSLDAIDLHKQTAGNPFFVSEVIASGGTGVPATVRDAVLARAARLGRSARAVLEIAAVGGPRLEPWLLEELAGAEATAVDECLALGVLRMENHAFMFRHELARQAVLDDVPAWRRLKLHAQVLAALESIGSIDAARLTHHAALGQASEAILRWAPEAARHAAQHGAHREAAAHYAIALEHATRIDPQQRAGLFEARAYECYLTGQIRQAIDAREAALALRQQAGERIGAGDNLRALSRLYWFLGIGEEARRYADEAVQTLATERPGCALALAYSNKAQLHMIALETESAIEWGERALDLAHRLEATEIVAHALTNVGMSRAIAGDDQGLRQLEQSLDLSLEHRFEEHAARAYCNLVIALVVRRAYASAAPRLVAALDYCSERDLDSWTTYLHTWRARIRLEQGRWDEAAADAAPLIERPGVPPVARMPALVTLATIRMRRDDPGAMALIDEADRLARTADELQRTAPVAVARAEAAWLAGDRERCLAEARTSFELAQRRREPWTLGCAAAWLWRAGACSEPPAGCAEPYRRLIAGDWRGAAEGFAALECSYERALALASGDAQAQAQALTMLDRLGARAAAQAVRRAMRERGVRSVPRGPRTTTRANAQGLTVRELDVLRLIVLGLSNAQIGARRHISVRTVDHHVAAILRKLDVASRGAAAARARDLRLLAEDRQSVVQT